jgi:hypothetical protein
MSKPRRKRKAADPVVAPVAPVRVAFVTGCRALGFSRSFGYKELKAGRLRATKVGNRNTLSMMEIHRYSAARDAERDATAAS